MFRWMQLFLGAIGLIALLRAAFFIWGMGAFAGANEYGLYLHVGTSQAKKLDLLFHVAGVFVLCVYILCTHLSLRQQSFAAANRTVKFFLVFSTSLVAVAALLWRPGNQAVALDVWVFAVLSSLWFAHFFIMLFFPKLLRFSKKNGWREQWNPQNNSRILAAFFVIALVQLFLVISPFTVSPLQLLNEYSDIPATTILFEADVKLIDKEYYDARGLLGPARRYLPERDHGKTPPIQDEVCMMFPQTPGLSFFLSEEQNRNSMVYNNPDQRLCAVDSVMPEQWLKLRLLAPDSIILQRIDGWYLSVKEYDRKLQETVLSRQDKQFFRVNQFSAGFQFSGMGVIHHHNFLLGPLNEYDLGKSRSEIYAQYGWLNLWLTQGIMKIVGDIDYQTYFRVWYGYYYLYYLLLFVLMWLIFRRWSYLAAGALLSIGLLCMIDYQWLLQPPGINPIRRLTELPLIFALFQLCKTFQRRYLWMVFVAIWLGILNNWQFGLMAMAAALITLGWTRWMQRERFQRIDDIFFGMFVLVSAALIAWMREAPDPLSVYYMAGVATIPLGEWTGLLILACFSLGAVLWLKTLDNPTPASSLCLFLLLYTSAIMTYSIWNASPTYLLVPGPLYTLTLLAFAQTVAREPSGNETTHNSVIPAILVGLGLLIFLAGSWNHEKTRSEFLGLMESHQNYQWNLDRAKFVSTMDPRYFEDSVAIIQRYSSGPAIHIVSKYDNFVPFLARKYSAMPYFELTKFLLSPRETAECIQRLKQDRPQILFVDTDIERDFAADIVHRHAPLGGLNGVSRYHVEQMRSLQRVFAAVKSDYMLVEQGLLISVYQRKK
jgi:hypothetical protein